MGEQKNNCGRHPAEIPWCTDDEQSVSRQYTPSANRCLGLIHHAPLLYIWRTLPCSAGQAGGTNKWKEFHSPWKHIQLQPFSNSELWKQISRDGTNMLEHSKHRIDASPLNIVSRCSPSSCALAHQTSSCLDRNGSCRTPSCSKQSSVCTSPACVSGHWWSIFWCASWPETCGLWGPGEGDKELGEVVLGAGTKMAAKAARAEKAIRVELNDIFLNVYKPHLKLKFYRRFSKVWNY